MQNLPLEGEVFNVDGRTDEHGQTDRHDEVNRLSLQILRTGLNKREPN